MSTLKLARPSGRFLLILVISACFSLVGVVIAIAGALSETSKTQSSAGFALFSAAFFVCGPLTLGLAFGGASEPRSLAKAGGLVGAGLMALLAAVFLSIGMALDNGIGSGIFGGAMCCGLPGLVLMGAGLMLGLGGVKNRNAELDREDAGLLVTALRKRPSASFAGLAQELDTDVDRVEGLLRSVADKLDGELIPKAGAWVSNAYGKRAREQLLGMIETQGHSKDVDLAKEIELPVEVVRVWIYELAGKGRFSGSVHWPDVWSGSAAALGGGACPGCGGTLSPAGKNRLACAHCGTERFVLPGAGQ